MRTKFPAIYSISFTILGIIGARLVAYYGNPLILYIFVPLISLMPIIIMVYENIENHILLHSTFLLVIALLYHVSLSFIYLSGADIFTEYYFASKTCEQGVWDPSIPEAYNTALSTTILPAMISILSGIDLITIFKILYPLIFSLVPIILFKAYMQIMSRREAFLSVFYFVSIFPFFTELLQIGKQMIAEVLLALMTYFVFVNKEKVRKSILTLMLVSFALIYSHYGTYYFWILLFSIAIFLTFVSNRYYNKLFALIITSSLMFNYLWYACIAGGSVLRATILIVAEFIRTLNWIFSPSHAQGVQYVVKEKTLMHKITTYLFLFSMFFIVMSIFFILYHIIIGKLGKSQDFRLTCHQALSVSALVIFGVASISTLSSALNITRFYQLSLFILAPHFIEGLKIFGKIISRNRLKSTCLARTAALFLMIFLLFNTGYVYEVSRFAGLEEESFSGALNPSMDSSTPSHSDLVAINWIKENAPLDNFVVGSDLFGRTFLSAYLPNSIIINLDKIYQLKPSLLFIRKRSCEHGLLDLWHVYLAQFRGYIPVEQFVSSKRLNKIFDSGCLIYFVQK